jgi:hypothetical protein
MEYSKARGKLICEITLESKNVSRLPVIYVYTVLLAIINCCSAP